MKNPEISIIVHTYGRAEFLKVMIQSVRNTTPREAYEILVVSSDPPETEKVKWLKQQEDIVFIQADIRRPWELRKQSAYYYINWGLKNQANPGQWC
jgi:glycosyltransferase involved in cell wall biosynthesis